MKATFELEWLGGPAGRRLERRRPGASDLPWGSLDLSRLDPADVKEARKVWTNGAFTEYASAAGFTAMAAAFLQCRAPIDLIAAASDCAVDEMAHTEIAARLVMELGGAVPLEFDFEDIAPATTADASALLRAAEIAIKVSCVGEALSVPSLTTAHRASSTPLTEAVLERLLRDEGAHASVGVWFLEWAVDRLTESDRAHLSQVAVDAIAVYAPLWERPSCPTCVLVPELGGAPKVAYQAALSCAVSERIRPTLARFGLAA